MYRIYMVSFQFLGVFKNHLKRHTDILFSIESIQGILQFISRYLNHTTIQLFKKCLIELIRETLVDKIIQVSGVQFSNASSVYCIACSAPQVKSPSIIIYSPFTLSYLTFHSQILPSQFYGIPFISLVNNTYLEDVWA